MAKIIAITQRPLPVFQPGGNVVESVEVTVSFDTGSTFTISVPRDQYTQQRVTDDIRALGAHVSAVDGLVGTDL